MADTFDIIGQCSTGSEDCSGRSATGATEIVDSPPPSILHGQGLHRIGNGRFSTNFRRDGCLQAHPLVDGLVVVCRQQGRRNTGQGLHFNSNT